MEVKMEDGEADKAAAEEKTPYDLLEESKASAEEIVSKLLSLKKNESNPIPETQLRELVTQMLLTFVSFRQVNRSILIDEDRVKVETESAKQPVDSTMLQLQNLVYEKSHYAKSISACKEFKSNYPDIELVPEEEFFKNAPDKIKGAAVADDTAHGLMLKRLNYELFQRKELCKVRGRLEQLKKSLLETIANRKKFVSSLPSHLKSLKKVSLPVQQQLGVFHAKQLKLQHPAEFLPPPLYNIYSQFMAQKEAFAEKIDVEIIGSIKDAQTFAHQQAARDIGSSEGQDSLKLDDVTLDKEDDELRRKKRHKFLGRGNLDQAEIYQAHPLRVILHIYDDENLDPEPAKLVTLVFECLVELNVVRVGIEGSDERLENSILCNLFPDDTGLELPHQTAKLFCDDGILFEERQTLRPYKWAQHLAGIDFLPEISPLLMGSEIQNTVSGKTAVVSGLALFRQQNRVQTIVQRARSRKKALMSVV